MCANATEEPLPTFDAIALVEGVIGKGAGAGACHRTLSCPINMNHPINVNHQSTLQDFGMLKSLGGVLLPL